MISPVCHQTPSDQKAPKAILGHPESFFFIFATRFNFRNPEKTGMMQLDISHHDTGTSGLSMLKLWERSELQDQPFSLKTTLDNHLPHHVDQLMMPSLFVCFIPFGSFSFFKHMFWVQISFLVF